MRMTRVATVIVLALFFAGCSATIPDLSPYSTATARLSSATTEVYVAAQASVNNRLMVAQKLPDSDPSKATLVADLQARANQLDKSVQVRKNVLAAFATYAESLVSIAESAANEQKKVDDTVKAAQSLADSLTALAPLPAVAPVGGTAKNIVELIGDGTKAVQQMRASKTLGEATFQGIRGGVPVRCGGRARSEGSRWDIPIGADGS